MKKIIGLSIAITLLSFISGSTGGIRFKLEYKPETRYNEQMNQAAEATVTYSGSDEFLEKLKDKGVPNPTVTNNTSKTTIILKTGKLKDTSLFPITMEFTSVNNSNGKETIPEGTIIYGYATVNTTPSFDSMYCPGMQDETKKEFMKTMESTLSQIIFPDKELSVGDSFPQETPISIPIAGTTIRMKISTVYKLISINGGQADFDISQHYSINIDKYTTAGGGSGYGHLTYDIAHNFDTSFEETTDMYFTMKTDDFSIKVDSKNTIKQIIVFSKI